MRFAYAFPLALVVLVACSDGDTPPGEDGGGTRDGGRVTDACLPAECEAPPVGCRYVGGNACDCGTLECDDAGVADDAGPTDDGGTTSDGGGSTDGGGTTDGGSTEPDACVPPPCPAPPVGCHYEGTDPCVCGTLVCEPPTDCSGVPCSPTEWCHYDTPYACGGTGTCEVRPGICITLFRPVCGCDGATHSNSCVAHSAGTDVAYEGDCSSTGPDCRTFGCPAGEDCQACDTPTGDVTFICLPTGAVC